MHASAIAAATDCLYKYKIKTVVNTHVARLPVPPASQQWATITIMNAIITLQTACWRQRYYIN